MANGRAPPPSHPSRRNPAVREGGPEPPGVLVLGLSAPSSGSGWTERTPGEAQAFEQTGVSEAT